MDARWVLVYVCFCLSGHDDGRGDFGCGLSEIGDRLRGVSVCPIACCGEVLERELRKNSDEEEGTKGRKCVCVVGSARRWDVGRVACTRWEERGRV